MQLISRFKTHRHTLTHTTYTLCHIYLQPAGGGLGHTPPALYTPPPPPPHTQTNAHTHTHTHTHFGTLIRSLLETAYANFDSVCCNSMFKTHAQTRKPNTHPHTHTLCLAYTQPAGDGLGYAPPPSGSLMDDLSWAQDAEPVINTHFGEGSAIFRSVVDVCVCVCVRVWVWAYGCVCACAGGSGGGVGYGCVWVWVRMALCCCVGAP